MAHGDNKNGDLLTLYAADHAMIADAIAPKACQWSSQALTKCFGVICSRDSILEVAQNLPLNMAVEAS